jgi:hypothetical protein
MNVQKGQTLVALHPAKREGSLLASVRRWFQKRVGI